MTTILVADDLAQNRYLLEALFQGMGYRVISAENGAAALALARSEAPDLVISDILMPEMDGFDLCRHMKMDESLKSIPFIFYTATYTEPKDESLALSLGAERFIIKPQDPAYLLSVVQEALREGFARREPVLGESIDAEMAYLRKHNEALFDKLDKKMRDLRTNQQLTQNLLDHSPSLICIVDREGRFLHVNRRLASVLGCPQDEVIGRAREDFLPREIAEEHRSRDLNVLASGTPLTFEEWRQEPDGEHAYVTVKFPLSDEQSQVYAVCGISTDITAQKKLERDLQQLSGLHVLLYQSNRAIRSARSEAELLGEACRLCVDHGRFDLAWIGWVPAPGDPLRADFVAGPMAGYARDLEILLDPALPQGNGPIGTCLREDRIVVCQDWVVDPSVAPWRLRAEPYGIRSSAALSIFRDDQALAVLSLYSAEPGFFTQERLELIQELAEDLSFGIMSLAQARRRDAAEKALAAREMEYRAVFEQGVVGMAQVSLEGSCLRVNPRFCELFGYGPEELIGRHYLEFTHPDDRELSMEQFRTPGTVHLQKRLVRKDGQSVWVNLSRGSVRNPEGQVLYYLTTFEDISQQKADEGRISEEKAKLQALLHNIPDLVWLKDLNGAYQYCNPRFEAYWGVTQAGILGKTDYDFVSKTQADWFTEYDRKVLETGAQVRLEEWVTFASDGHRELQETIKTAMRDASGRPIGVLGIARDVTQSRLDQDWLRKLSKAIEHSPVVVLITDRDGTIEYANPRFTELTGFSAEEAIGANPRILKSGITPPEVYADLWNTILAGGIWHGELQNRKKNRELYWEATSISPILDDSGAITHFVALKEDITSLKRVQTELQGQLSELRRWHEATLGREMRILDLKREVNELLLKAGQPVRYESLTREDGGGR